jgi:hypothetical protein
MAQHAELTQERWSSFTIDQQILMIANEMNRASTLVSSGDLDRAKNCYERVLQLTDLTVRGGIQSTLRGELLRWRDLIAELYLEDRAQPDEHRRAFRCLLRFTPETSRQIPYLGAAAAAD